MVTTIGRLLRWSIPPAYLVGHLRQREFAVLIDDGLSVSEVEHMADRVVANLRISSSLESDLKGLTVVVGVGYSSHANCEAADLLRMADIALYYAYATGRGRYVIVDKIPFSKAA